MVVVFPLLPVMARIFAESSFRQEEAKSWSAFKVCGDLDETGFLFLRIPGVFPQMTENPFGSGFNSLWDKVMGIMIVADKGYKKAG